MGMTPRSQAILVMLSGVLMLVVNDTAAKWLLSRYDPLQIAFVRSAVALPLVAVLTWRFGGFRSHRLRIHALRALLVVLATLAFFQSMRSLSLAEAASLLFTAPIIVAALVASFVNERVGARRWASVLLGFAGVLVIVRPGMEAFRPGSLHALLAAFLYALIMLSARWIDARDGFWTMTFHMTVFSTLFGAVSLLADWPIVEAGDAGLFAIMAILGTGGAALISQAFRMAPATLVAPLDYTALLWASLMGWLVWGTVPGWPVYAGATIIVASGILLLRTEDGCRSG